MEANSQILWEKEKEEGNEIKERESCRTSGQESRDLECIDPRSNNPLQGFWNILNCSDIEMYISPNSDSFQSVYVAYYVPGIVPSPLHVLTHLIKFPLTFTVSRFMEFSPGDF